MHITVRVRLYIYNQIATFDLIITLSHIIMSAISWPVKSQGLKAQKAPNF